MSVIIDVVGREILDSRGNPTVEVDVLLEDGAIGRAAVPSGASTGAHEAVELRDGDAGRYGGKGVRRAVEAVNGAICDALTGLPATDQVAHRPQRCSSSTAPPTRAGSAPTPSSAPASPPRRPRPRASGTPLYRYVGGVSARTLPVPMMNIINGGAHADNPIDIQEFMIMPVGAESLAEAVRIGAGDLPRAEEGARRRPGTTPTSATRAASRPTSPRPTEALDFIMKSIEAAGYKPGERRLPRPRLRRDRVLQGRRLRHGRRGQERSTPEQNVDYLAGLVDAYPIISIEDGMSEDDWDGWKLLTEKIGDRCQLVGDDLFVTNTERLKDGHREGHRQLDPRQGQPDRLADRDARRRRHGAPRRLHRRDVAPLGRDRGRDHRRPRGGDQLRPDQDRLAVALRPARQVQPAHPHRGGSSATTPSTPDARS